MWLKGKQGGISIAVGLSSFDVIVRDHRLYMDNVSCNDTKLLYQHKNLMSSPEYSVLIFLSPKAVMSTLYVPYF